VQQHNDKLRDQHSSLYGHLKKLATLEAQEAAETGPETFH
jgi:hypothetical protein